MKKIMSLSALIMALSTLSACASNIAIGNDLGARISTHPITEDHYPVRTNNFAHGVTGYSDVVYSVIPGFRPLTLDVYVPQTNSSNAKLPLILYVHGGGWSTGHARHSAAIDNYPEVLANLAARGYIVASLNYRLSSEAQFPAAEIDVQTALRFLKSHSVDYKIDTSKTGIMGGSAGGHLVSLAALACGENFGANVPQNSPDACVQAAAIWYGVFDFNSLPPGAAVDKFLGCTGEACVEAKRRASPITYVKSNGPAMLMITGRNDRTVPFSQSVELDSALKASGNQSELLIIDEVDHSFIGKTPEATRAANIQAIEATVRFFDAHLKGAHQ